MLADSVSLEQVAQAVENKTVERLLTYADVALQEYPALFLNTVTVERVLHGNSFAYDALPAELARVYDMHGHFLAIATWNIEQNMWQPKKVFHTNKEDYAE